ncbi:MAG: hypothetical protein ACKO0U_10600 [Gammaproteobacteria bacterium]
MAIGSGAQEMEQIGTSPEAKRPWRPLALGPSMAEPALTEANLGFLERAALAAGAQPRSGVASASCFGLSAEHASRLLRLLPAERARLATAPFALWDLRFGDSHYWAGVLEARAAPPPSLPSASRWVRGATVLAWHLAQRGGLIAALSVGMTPGVQALWSAMPLGALEAVAAAGEDVLSARWAGHPRFWDRMLQAIERDDESALVAVRHLGWQLLATDGLRPTLARRRLNRG